MSQAETRHQVQHRAWAAEERARLMIDSIRDYAVFMLDPSGVIQSWNPGAQRIKGYLPEEIIGQHFSRFYPEAEVKAGKCDFELATAANTGRFEEEGWRLRKDGSRFWANVVISAMRDESGQLIGFVKVTRDLTERRHAEERLRLSEERFRILVGSVQDYAIFMLDAEGRIATWNTGAERLKQYTADEIVGQHFSRFYPPEDIARRKPEHELEEAARVGRFEDEGWRLRKDGSRFWANVALTAMRDASGTLIGFAKVTRDLTERRAAEEERVRLAHAQEAIRLRDEFLSLAAHELRTPLTALRLQLQTLGQRVASLDPKVVTTVERANRSSDRLVELVERLLDVSRITSGHFTLKLEPMSLSEVVTELSERFQEEAERARSELVVRCEPGLTGTWDRRRLEQVVIHLLANALEYAAGARVEVSLTREGEWARLEISDRGPGIREADLPRLFGRFERAAPIEHHGGLGLGLFVTREIVTAHGGTVKAENRPGGGAVFTVRLPLQPPAPPSSQNG